MNPCVKAWGFFYIHLLWTMTMKDFLIDLVVCICIGGIMFEFLLITYGLGL